MINNPVSTRTSIAPLTRAAVTTTPTPINEIESRNQQLGDAIHELEAKLQQLAERVDSVLLPQAVAAPSNAGQLVRPESCPLARSLDDHIDNINRLFQFASNIEDRVRL